MELTKRILFNKYTKADNKSEWLDYIKTVSEEWYEEIKATTENARQRIRHLGKCPTITWQPEFGLEAMQDKYKTPIL